MITENLLDKTTGINKDNWRINCFSIVIFLLIPIFLYGKYFIANKTLGDLDYALYFIGQKYVGQQLLSGIFPQWNIYLAAGTPEITISGMYVVSLLLSFLPLKLFIYSFYFFHLVLGATSFYFYLKEKGCSYNIAFVLAVIFEISIQINGIRKEHVSIVAAICIFPLIMLLARKFLNTGKRSWLHFSAIVTAIQTTAFIQCGIYAIISLFIYIALFLIIQKKQLKTSLIFALSWLCVYIGTISFFLFPMLSVLKEYKSFGSSATDYTTFASYSMHPIKILMIVFPLIFGKDVYQPLGNMNSSELDIEIFFGTVAFILFLISLRQIKNDNNSKVEIICLILSFFYTCIAHIPIMRAFVFKIPVLNGFRCSGRFLYIFNFFYLSLIASALSYYDNNFKLSFIKLIKKYSGIICGIIVFLGIIVFAFQWGNDQTPKKETFNIVKDIFMKPFLFSLATFIISFAIETNISITINDNSKIIMHNNSFIKKNILLVFFLISTSLEVLPYSLLTLPKPIGALNHNDNISQIVSSDSKYKIWDALPAVGGTYKSIISQNRNIINKVQGINSYISFNNPNLVKYFDNLGRGINNIPFNLTGLNTGSVTAGKVLTFKNDFLSMLGVRYILDSGEIIKKADGNIYKKSISQDILFETKEILISEFYDINKTKVGVNNICMGKFSPNTIYDFEFDFFCDDISDLSYFCIDLYGGAEYDFAEQEYPIDIKNKQNGHIHGSLYSGDTSVATMPITMRALVLNANKIPILLKNFKIYENKVIVNHAYDFYSLDENSTEVYINNNACSLIYSPKAIKSIGNRDNLYLGMGEYELDKYAYLEETEYKEIKPVSIKETNISTNSISVLIDSPEDSYICLSQCYSKYWKLKIDGIPQKIDFVNGIIMGCTVPGGLHQVVFYYSNYNYLLGIIVTILTISITIWFILKKTL